MSFTIACSFGPGRVPNDTFDNAVYLYADNVQVAEAVAPTVTLNLSEDFVLEKRANVDNLVRPEEELTFTLSIINKGDYASVITNVNISDTLPAELIPITSYVPIGNDVPTSGYSDSTYNGRTGAWNGSTLEFSLPSFSGARYWSNINYIRVLNKKMVKGERDLEYTNNGKTLAGGSVDYRLYITNNQKISLKNIEIIDILPYVGDRGVILTTARGSQFNVYATSGVSAKIVNLIGEPVEENPEITIEYSTSNDPIRFDSLGNIVGVGTWSLIPPTDITTLRSIKVTTGENVILKSYERLIIEFSARVPTGVSPNLTAYNSFATRANQIIDDQNQPLLPTEPNKVALKIISSTGGGIGDFVWDDKNGNGIHDDGEPGVKIEEECRPPIIKAKDRCIEVCDIFCPLEGVCASNCKGEDITKDIKVIENTVNDFMPGVYKVTYQVTDSLNQTTSKTIKVTVC